MSLAEIIGPGGVFPGNRFSTPAKHAAPLFLAFYPVIAPDIGNGRKFGILVELPLQSFGGIRSHGLISSDGG
jgi:hypothetical protein